MKNQNLRHGGSIVMMFASWPSHACQICEGHFCLTAVVTMQIVEHQLRGGVQIPQGLGGLVAQHLLLRVPEREVRSSYQQCIRHALA